MTMPRELGVPAVAMASPSAHLGLYGGDEGKGMEVEVEVS
jgi:hypothetical protein